MQSGSNFILSHHFLAFEFHPCLWMVKMERPVSWHFLSNLKLCLIPSLGQMGSNASSREGVTLSCPAFLPSPEMCLDLPGWESLRGHRGDISVSRVFCALYSCLDTDICTQRSFFPLRCFHGFFEDSPAGDSIGGPLMRVISPLVGLSWVPQPSACKGSL